VDPVIVFFSSIDFDFIYQRPQALVEKISERKVPGDYFARSFRKDGSLNRSRLNYRHDRSVRAINDCLTVVRVNRYFEFLGVHFRFRGKLMRLFIRGWIASYLKKLARQGRLIAVFEGVTWWNEYVGDFPFDRKCFDLIDDPAVFGGRAGKDEAAAELTATLDSCDRVFYTADRLGEFLESRGLGAKSVHLPNGVLWDRFQNPRKSAEIETLREAYRKITGYVGYLGAWIDVETLVFCAGRLTDHAFVFVGPGVEKVLVPLRALPNVRLLGTRPHAEIPSCIRSFDVCLNPFLVGEIGNSTNPIKLYEYFACGKPVVSTAIHEALNLRDLLYIGTDPEDFSRKIKTASEENDPEPAEKRREFARNNSWDRRAETFLKAVLADEFEGRGRSNSSGGPLHPEPSGPGRTGA
jgi:glycosyltransferase involved in cell wall biosynthesis